MDILDQNSVSGGFLMVSRNMEYELTSVNFSYLIKLKFIRLPHTLNRSFYILKKLKENKTVEPIWDFKTS